MRNRLAVPPEPDHAHGGCRARLVGGEQPQREARERCSVRIGQEQRPGGRRPGHRGHGPRTDPARPVGRRPDPLRRERAHRARAVRPGPRTDRPRHAPRRASSRSPCPTPRPGAPRSSRSHSPAIGRSPGGPRPVHPLQPGPAGSAGRYRPLRAAQDRSSRRRCMRSAPRAVAATDAAEHDGDGGAPVTGLMLYASYPASDLSGLSSAVLSVSGNARRPRHSGRYRGITCRPPAGRGVRRHRRGGSFLLRRLRPAAGRRGADHHPR